MNYRNRLRSLWYLDTTATEIWLSIISVASGFWVGAFGSISVPFRLLGHSICLGVATWLLCLGVVRFCAVFVDKPLYRVRCAFCAFATWIFLVYASLLVDHRSLLIVMYAVPAAMSLWVLLRTPARRYRPKESQ